jgi:hypothetical protein
MEQGNLKIEIGRAIQSISNAELSVGLLPRGLMVTQITRYIADRGPSQLRRVTDKDISRALENGITLEVPPPFSALEISLKPGNSTERGRQRLVFRPLVTRPRDEADKEVIAAPKNLGLNELLKTESLYLGQNLESVTPPDQSLRFGCFVCLPGEWSLEEAKPVYQLNIERQSRVEGEDFQFRTLELITLLEELGLNFSWNFLIADTDLEDIFGSFVKKCSDNEEIIKEFIERISSTFSGLSHSITIERWSNIQRSYQSQYEKDKERTEKLTIIREDIEKRFDGRLTYYREYFARLGLVPNKKLLEPLCTQVPSDNIKLYSAQGPIIKDRYDCLVILDRDPTRLGRYHSLLTPDLPIWYPYNGG